MSDSVVSPGTRPIVTLSPGTRVSVVLSRVSDWDGMTPILTDWVITGTIARLVNNDPFSAVRGAMSGIRLIDATCDDSSCSRSSHVVSVSAIATIC